MAGRWATLAVEAQATNAIDYKKPVNPLKEALIFNYLETKRLALCITAAPVLSDADDLMYMTAASRHAILKRYLPFIVLKDAAKTDTDSNKAAHTVDQRDAASTFNTICAEYMRRIKKDNTESNT